MGEGGGAVGVAFTAAMYRKGIGKTHRDDQVCGNFGSEAIQRRQSCAVKDIVSWFGCNGMASVITFG